MAFVDAGCEGNEHSRGVADDCRQQNGEGPHLCGEELVLDEVKDLIGDLHQHPEYEESR